MKVDARLTHLQALIERKRAEQMLAGPQKAVGRAGNPRFSAAAERVRLAMQNKAVGQPSPGNSTPLSHPGQISKTQNVGNTVAPLAPHAVEQGGLTVTGLERTLQVVQTGPRSANPPHLGRNVDTYA